MVDVVPTLVDDDMTKDRPAAPAEDGVDTQLIQPSAHARPARIRSGETGHAAAQRRQCPSRSTCSALRFLLRGQVFSLLCSGLGEQVRYLRPAYEATYTSFP